MMLETTIKKQGNSNVIIIPRQLNIKQNDKVKVIVMKQNVATVNDIAGLFAGKLKNINRDKLLKEVKEELWGE